MIDQAFNGAQLVIRNRLIVRKVEAGARGIHQRPLLSDMVAQYGTQGGMQQVGGGMVPGGALARQTVHMSVNGFARADAPGLHGALVAKHTGLNFLCVDHF